MGKKKHDSNKDEIFTNSETPEALLEGEIEVEEEKIVEKPPVIEKKVVEELPKIPLRVFKKVSGIKWDQLAGFERYAIINKLKPMSIPAWKDTYKAFLNKPTN